MLWFDRSSPGPGLSLRTGHAWRTLDPSVGQAGRRPEGAPVTPRVVLLADVAPQAWRNGGGQTHELLTWPGDGGWSLRISVARIERDGPFSSFPGAERWFTVIDGAGVILQLDEPRRLVPGGAPIRFDGARMPQCRLIDGPTLGLDLMLRGQSGRMLAALPGTRWHSDARQRGLYAAAAGRWSDSQGRQLDLPAGSLLWCDDDVRPGHYASFDARGWWIAAGPSEGLQ